MKSFKDTAGRNWQISVNVESIKRVRAEVDGLDLCAAVEGDVINRLQNDPILLAGVLYALCKPAADQQNVTPEQFGEALAGDAIEAATVALLEDLADFFPKTRRAMIRKALEKYTQVEAAATRRAGEEIDKMDPDALIAKVFGNSSTASPESSASTPAPSPSAS
jgi:hypothetical protein